MDFLYKSVRRKLRIMQDIPELRPGFVNSSFQGLVSAFH